MNTIDTTNWVRIPFQSMGHNFNSVLDPEGSIYNRVQQIPRSAFLAMNESAIREMWADRKNLSVNELLAVINDGGTQAFVELV